MCIENESTGKYTSSHAPYTRFTSVMAIKHANNIYYWEILIYDHTLTLLVMWHIICIIFPHLLYAH